MVPADVANLFQPIPDGFTPPCETEKTGRVLIWRGSVPDGQPNSAQRLKVEVGAVRAVKGGDPAAYETLKAEVWQVMELARLGRQDLLSYARTDRRKAFARPISKPEIPPPPA